MTKIEEPLEKGWLRNVMRDVQIELEARRSAVAQVQHRVDQQEQLSSGGQISLAAPLANR